MIKKRKKEIYGENIIFLILILVLILIYSKNVWATDAGTREDALKWVYAQEGKSLDYDGAYGAQCVDLIKYYYAYFGQEKYARGNGCGYVSNTLPSGWTRIKNTAEFVPEPGDIAVWGTELSSDGHVAIILSANEHSFISMDQNWPSGSKCKQVTHTYNKFWGVIRPNFSNSTPDSTINNPYYNSYGFDVPSSNSTISESTFLFQGWIDAKKKISTITCSINHGVHYVEAALYKRSDVPNATAFRVEANANLLKTGKNDVALCVNFADGTATVVENRSVTWSPKLIWGYDSPTDGMKIVDNQFPFYGWIESARKLDRVTCSLNQGEKYLTANLYKRPDVPNATAFRLDIDTSNLHYGDNSVSICAHYADGSSQTIATRKVRRSISDAIEYPQNNEKFTCKNSKFLLQGWSTNDSKEIDHFAFTINGTKFLTSAHTRSDLSGNARYYREEILLSRLKNGNNKIEIFAYYTDGTSRNIGQVNVVGDIAHTWDAGKVTQEATCNTAGTKTYTCTTCQTTRTEEIPATGKHQNTEVRNSKEATCTEEGYTGDTYCKDCGTKLSSGEKIAKTGHKWDTGKVTQEATCNTAGTKTYTCTTCQTTRTEEILATGKHQNTEVRNQKEATCTEEGYTGDTYCKDCGTKLSSGKTIAKTGHKWDAGKVTQEATCTSKGIKTYTCAICESTRIEELPSTGHRNTELRNAKEATCIEEGYTGDIYCKDCGVRISVGQKISKTAHNWDNGKTTQEATCTSGGVKTYTCTNCQATRTEEIPATGHGTQITKFAKKASCKSEGYTGDIYCQTCGEMLKEGDVLPKTEHSWDGGKVTKQPTVTATGVRTYTCRNCKTTKTSAIAKLKLTKLTPGKTVRDNASNGIYKVLKDGVTVEFTKSITKRTTVKIPDTVKISGITCKVTGIAANAFKNNTTLKTITIGKNVATIGTNAFYGCKNLVKVAGGNGIVKISNKAFGNCINLTGITIPQKVRSIGTQAFYNCKKLKTIIIKTSTLTTGNVGAKAFAGTHPKPTVKVPAKQIKTYGKLLKTKGMSTKAIYKQ